MNPGAKKRQKERARMQRREDKAAKLAQRRRDKVLGLSEPEASVDTATTLVPPGAQPATESPGAKPPTGS